MVVSECTYQWLDNCMYFWTLFPVSSVKQLSVRFLQHCEAPWFCCCIPAFRNCSCLKHWGVLLNVHLWSEVTISITGQWIVHILAVDAPRYLLALGYGYSLNVWVLSSVTEQVRCLYVAWFSRSRCFYLQHRIQGTWLWLFLVDGSRKAVLSHKWQIV